MPSFFSFTPFISIVCGFLKVLCSFVTEGCAANFTRKRSVSVFFYWRIFLRDIFQTIFLWKKNLLYFPHSVTYHSRFHIHAYFKKTTFLFTNVMSRQLYTDLFFSYFDNSLVLGRWLVFSYVDKKLFLPIFFVNITSSVNKYLYSHKTKNYLL